MSEPRPGGDGLPVPSANDRQPDDPAASAIDAPASTPDTLDPPSRPRTFSLDGRAAPGLYLIGWLGTLLGLGTTVVGVIGGVGPLFLIALVILSLGLLAAGGAQALERSRRLDLAYRGPSPWLVFAAVIALSLVVQVAIILVARAAGIPTTLPLLTTALLAATALVYAAIVRFLVVGTGALSWADMGLRVSVPQALSDLLIGGFLAFPVLIATGVVGIALSQVLPPPPNPLPPALTPFDVIANLLTAAVIAPIGEELFFRGFATTAWARTGGVPSAIVRGAIFFSLAHVLTLGDLQQSLYAFLVRLPVGIALGWLYLERRSLPASIGMHAAFNGIQVLLLASISQGGGPPG